MQIFIALLGFSSLIAMVLLLIYDKTSPAVTFILISSFVGFLLVGMDSLSFFGISFGVGEVLGIKSGVFGLKELAGFVKKGIGSVAETAALFIFSILFFTIMSVAGVFNTVINTILSKCRINSTYSITLLTVFVATVSHLDGSGASTFLITIPALLPIYQKFHMRTTTLMLLATASMGIMNLLPWGGPTLRVASVLNVDATELYFQLMPMQIVGLVLAFAIAIIMGAVEKRRLAKEGITFKPDMQTHEFKLEEDELKRENRFMFNVSLFFVVLVVLFTAGLPSYFPFMIGSALALVMNYPCIKTQDKVVKKASGAAMMMATTLLAAGILIGVFDKSGIMKIMASAILDIMPHSVGMHLVIIVGLLAVPMAIIFCTDSYFYGILPIMISVGAAFGIDAIALGIVMVVCRNCATFISPVVPATLLGCGLSGVSIREHIRTSFFWVWGISVICLVCGIIFGIIKL